MRVFAGIGALAILAGCAGDNVLPGARPLSPDGVRHLAQSYSPDGKRIAYWSPVTEGQQLWVANADLSAPVKLPVTNVGFSSVAVWSPDGSRLAAASSQFGVADVVVVPTTGGEAQRVTTGPGVEVPLVWYPDGDRLAYFASAGGGTFSSFVVSVRTGVSTSLVPGEKRPFIGMPSPDGSHIGYMVAEGSKTAIWVADSAGGNPRQLTTEGFESFSQGSTGWSPDGKEVLYESRRTGTTDLWVVPIAGGAARQLTRDVRNDKDAAWSPDGKWVAFRSDRGRQTDVWVVPAAGGEERRVTDSADEEQAPLAWRLGANELTFTTVTQTAGIWAMDLASGAERKLTPDSIRTVWFNLSPDGEQVNYVVERGGGVQDLAVVPLAGGQARTLVSGGGTVLYLVWGPLWSPDGSKIVFSSDRGGTQDIWVVDAAGGAPRQLTNWPGFESSSVWSGDGTAVYFQADRDTKLGDVWKVAASGGEPVRVTNDGTVGGGVIARAGVTDLIGAVLNRAAGQFSVARIRPDGRMNVVWNRTNASAVSISPSGDSVAAHVEQPNGKLQMMILPAAGGAGRTILGPDELGFGNGGWSSDGKSMLFGTNLNGAYDLSILTLADGTKRRLTMTPESEEGAEFTPDAKTVVFRRSTTVQRLNAADLTRLLRAPAK